MNQNQGNRINSCLAAKRGLCRNHEAHRLFIPVRIFSLILFLLSGISTRAQETYEWINDSATIKTITTTRAFIVEELKLQTGDDFYAWETDSITGHIKCRTVKNMYCYVYAWDPRTKRSPLGRAFRYFGTDEKAAKAFEDSLKAKKYETMLYKTAGTSAAQITSRLLQYGGYSIRYILLHEAVHRHRGNTNSHLPYVFEEALCDVVAIKGLQSLINDESLWVYSNVDWNLHDRIKKAIDGKNSLKKCSKQVAAILREGDAFQKDRFGYTVNHAYLERYTSYCKYYFLIEKLWKKTGSWQNFFDKVFKLEGTEEEVAAQLRKLAR